jgi:glucose/arabinose dehydrogenase
MAWLPNGDLLITERPGRLRRVSNGVLEPTPISGLPDVLAQGQGGLLDIALHPQFETNGLIYLAYADGTRRANRTQVARARLQGDTLSDWTVIFANNRDKSGANTSVHVCCGCPMTRCWSPSVTAATRP